MSTPTKKKVQTTYRDWRLAVLNLIFPQFCGVCGLRLLTAEQSCFCPECWEESPRIERPFCSKCGKPHPGMVGLGSPVNFLCADCREKPNRYVRRMYAAAYYHGPMETAIKRLKFEGKTWLAEGLGEVMRDFAVEEMEVEDYDFIVPVPLHRVRERDRGFNQSHLLSEAILPAFPGAEINTALERIRPTRTQSRMKASKERRANVRGAFAVVGEELKGRRVLLIDDVITSAGTVTECARALVRAKVESVDVLVAAVAVPHYSDLL